MREMLIRAVGLAGYERYYPHELSGGMRKRAALIRTLAYDPPMILMDEPFAAVDAQTRTQLQADLLKLWSLGPQDHHLRHPRHHRGDCARRPRAGAQPPAGAHRRRARDPDPAPAQRAGHLRARGLRRRLRAHPGGDPMTELTAPTISEAPQLLAQVDRSSAAGCCWRCCCCWPGRSGRARSAPSSSRRRSRVLARIGELAVRRQARDRHRRDPAGGGARLRDRLRRRRAAAVPAAPLAARDRRGRALHHGHDGDSQIRAGALAHPLVRHRRHAEARGRGADGVLHRVHHDLRRASARSISG